MRACSKCPEDVRSRLSAAKASTDAANNAKRKREEEVEAIKNRKEAAAASASGSSAAAAGSSAAAAGSSAAAAASGQGSNDKTERRAIVRAFKLAQSSAADKAIMKFFACEGIPFNKARGVWWREMISAVATAGPGYVPPAYNAMRSTLLDNLKSSTESELLLFDMRSKDTMVSLCSDGWTDVAKHPLLNVLAVNPIGAKFLTAINTEGEVKSGLYIGAALIECIEGIGPEHVVQVVTDGAANCAAAGRIIMEKYPHITWTICTPHAIDLTLEQIFAMGPFEELISKAKRVVMFINNHQQTLAAYRALEESVLALLKPGETRFATSFIMLQRVHKQSSHLQRLVVSQGWQSAVARLTAEDRAKAAEIKLVILDDNFWEEAKEAMGVVEPLVSLLRLADGTAPCMGKIYYRMSKCLEHVRSGKHKLDADVLDQVADVISNRWEYLHSPMHGAGYCLDPEFWGDAGNNAECMGNLITMIERLLPTAAERKAAREQFVMYKNKEELFAVHGAAVQDAPSMPAHQWWGMYGSGCKELQRVAVGVLSQVSAAVSCERNWSTYDYIHSKKRNKLAPARARDLVYVFSNQRLLRKLNSGTHQEEFVPWDSEDEQEGDAAAGSDGDEEEEGVEIVE
ncbi:hypothetical protein OEZ85_004845 [Tetradesmus obliquus]|uniref:DUF659 domain-containing protein n=1 Tax=Tetradesmus obliquus TaxID=3088 RepID=A0ABY8UJG9_TETOB|nr:hypothetical protein OEZ85_004845 [Tetradesmus obliquus]